MSPRTPRHPHSLPCGPQNNLVGEGKVGVTRILPLPPASQAHRAPHGLALLQALSHPPAPHLGHLPHSSLVSTWLGRGGERESQQPVPAPPVCTAAPFVNHAPCPLRSPEGRGQQWGAICPPVLILRPTDHKVMEGSEQASAGGWVPVTGCQGNSSDFQWWPQPRPCCLWVPALQDRDSLPQGVLAALHGAARVVSRRERGSVSCRGRSGAKLELDWGPSRGKQLNTMVQAGAGESTRLWLRVGSEMCDITANCLFSLSTCVGRAEGLSLLGQDAQKRPIL